MKRFGGPISPFLVFALSATWLLLNQTIAPAQIALGIGLALLLAWAASALRPLRARVRRLDVAIALVIVVLADIVRSNLAVARLVLRRKGPQELHSEFLRIPIELRDPHGLAALAIIVTSTPGTVWAGMSPEGDTLTLHVLDLKDGDQFIQHFKQRYERPLMRIFE
jgi:multicomponent K+:H+ antiporter subunit E